MRNKGFMLGALLITSSAVMADATTDQIKAQIQKIDQRIPVSSVAPAKIPGMYEVVLGSGEVIYSDAKGEYFLLGQLYQLTDEKGFVNLSEEKSNELRKELLAAVPDAEMVIFKAKGKEKATVSVFTDVDCQYCRKLHAEVPALQELGITVKYLAFPRQGPSSLAFSKMEKIWCSDDRLEAMTISKKGGDVDAPSCDNPVRKQFDLGQKVGVTGTPAIVTQDGRLIPGYMPADRLAATLGVK